MRFEQTINFVSLRKANFLQSVKYLIQIFQYFIKLIYYCNGKIAD